MSTIEVHQFPCLGDNYGVLVHDPDADVTASIDAPDADAVRAGLAAKGWRLTHILTTHHHGDHTAGNAELKAETGCTIVGPKAEATKIPGIDVAVGDGDTFAFGTSKVRVIGTPGHTLGHIVYWLPDIATAFVGDTLFAMGCGRLFEGTPEMMWTSLQKLAGLPPETQIYCGHEYTLANARFAMGIEPDNAALTARLAKVEGLRAAGQPTLPTRIDLELATNPFLRASRPTVKAHLGMAGFPDWQVFAEIRERKNRG